MQVDLHGASAVAGQYDESAVYENVFHCFFLHVVVNLFLYEQIANGRPRVAVVETKFILMSVHRIGHHVVGLTSHLQAWNITFFRNKKLHGACLLALKVIAPDADIRIALTCQGIFIDEITQAIILHLALIIANPAQHGTVAGESQRAVETELFFVYPVRHAIDNLIALAVLCHLRLSIVVEQSDKEYIVVADKGHITTVGTPYRRLLRSKVTKWSKHTTLNVVNIIVGGERAAINALHVVPHQHPSSIRTHVIAGNLVNLVFQRIGGIKKDTILFSAFHGKLKHFRAVVAHGGIAFSVCEHRYLTNGLRGIYTAGDIFQIQICLSHNGGS